jgi:hypothetical protein
MATVTAFAGTMQGWTGVQSGGISWFNPDNAKVSNGVYATASPGGDIDIPTQTTTYLYFRNFAFGIGAGATINGITVNIRLKSTESTTCKMQTVRLASATNTLIGANKASNEAIPTSDTTFTYGNATDLWTATITQSTVSSSNFGFIYTSQCTNGFTAQTVSVDYATITVDYSGGASSAANIACCACETNTGSPPYFAF